MLNPVKKWHHVLVAAAVAITPVLVLLGFAGRGMYPERFDAKQVLVTPVGDGVRIREVVDQDFGNTERHGYERFIPNDFGDPIDIVASSPDAPADVGVQQEFDVSRNDFVTRVRIGDPDTTITGQHRYILEYTLPEARLSSGSLALDIIGDQEEFETGRFEVVVSGFEFAGTTCNVGSFGTSGGCELTSDGPLYRTVFEPLLPGQGVTIGGDIAGIVEPADVPIPELPTRRTSHQLVLALVTAALGLTAGLGGYLLARRMGRNEVGGDSAADAAFGSDNDGPVRLVTDKELEALATTEFEAPRGLRPWHGALLLEERVSASTVSAWFSDQIAQEVIELSPDGDRITPGAKLNQAPPVTQQRVAKLLGTDDVITLGSYRKSLTDLWTEITEEQKVAAKESGWWKRGSPGSNTFPPALFAVMVLMAGVLFMAFWAGLRQSVIVTVFVSFFGPALAALISYAALLPRRSASGSAAALKAESFRNFLEKSEGQHVDWAWKHGLLREYSAWAVALGAADAWGRAIAKSAVPPQDVSTNTLPLLMYTHSSMWHSTYTPPSSSGSGGSGGGFSGGFSGGGGGGGSSGSW
ncbi:MAG: DUF2207 domain-containing protein [Actinobacteria bacterium]|nr:DUF2207 domain-containing protein [Actinomycetota bacterium]